MAMLRKIVECAPHAFLCRFEVAEEEVMLKLRGGTAAFQVETGRWRRERIGCARSVTAVKWRM